MHAEVNFLNTSELSDVGAACGQSFSAVYSLDNSVHINIMLSCPNHNHLGISCTDPCPTSP